MHGLIRHILRTALTLLIAVTATSCVYDEEPQQEPTDNSLLSVRLSMPMAQAEGGAENGYVAGDENENYLDIKNEGYRIYFFDNANKFITRFIPIGVTPADGDKTTYDVLGLVPNELIGKSDYKIVVLANWSEGYPDDKLETGVSTIDELCGYESSQYDCLTNFDLDSDKRLIPFFGLHHYNVSIEKGELTTLNEPIALLRAMAKIEVEVDIDGLSLTNVNLHGYNARGYCAPAGVHEHGDYDHGGVWADDYVKIPHLIGDKNDADPAKAIIPLMRKYEADGNHRETWIAYVPEYRNTDNPDGSKNFRSQLELRFDYQDKNDAPYTIFFKEYNAEGKPIDNSDFNILRNNLYHFTVTLGISGLVIKVKKWENAYDNDFIFE